MNKNKKYTIKVDYYAPRNKSVVTESGFRYRDTREEIKKTEIFEGTLEEIFLKFEKLNNTLKYCNGHYWKFSDSKFQEQQRKWYSNLPESVKFDLYYGNGVVD